MAPQDDPRAPRTRIGQHGVIGDLETLALVGHDATIEWFCWPRFDSPSLFGSLLDPDGGHWSIAPVGDRDAAVADAPGPRERRLYLPGTNVLVSRFHLDDALVEVEDCLVIDAEQRMLVRRVRGVRGSVRMRLDLAPRPDYGRAAVQLEQTPPAAGTTAVRLAWSDDDLVLSATVELRIDDGRVDAEFVVAEGDEHVMALGPRAVDVTDGAADALDATAAYWRAWIGRSTYRGRWQEVVERSALTLKLLTHRPSGGLLAAGTASLPETIGGGRNWDYRYVWIRDAAFVLYAFIELGFLDEAEAFTGWLQERVRRCDRSGAPPLRPLYDLDGDAQLPELELDHWEGYACSAPVRVGNAAADQLQLDIYGELIDSLYLADKHGPGLSLDAWDAVCHLADWVCANWDQPDDGFWEVRDGPHEHTSSRLMCWVALERAIRMARFRGRPADVERWAASRDAIHAEIVTRGWNDELGAFTRTLDGDSLDASLLLMPLVKFVAPTDPRWLSTLDAIGRTLTHDALVDRYPQGIDGMDGDQGSFSICSFWYVEALARAGRVDEARLLFEKILTYSGPLGLFSETISSSGEQLGNFPQAFTHLSLISAAVALHEAEHR